MLPSPSIVRHRMLSLLTRALSGFFFFFSFFLSFILSFILHISHLSPWPVTQQRSFVHRKATERRFHRRPPPSSPLPPPGATGATAFRRTRRGARAWRLHHGVEPPRHRAAGHARAAAADDRRAPLVPGGQHRGPGLRGGGLRAGGCRAMMCLGAWVRSILVAFTPRPFTV